MKYRVVQWASGAMGKTVLRAIIDHPGMELVGLFTYGKDKVGRDAGDIARRPDTGIRATDSIEDILALDADVVIHCARRPMDYGSDAPHLARLLSSGKNVIIITGYSHPGFWHPEVRAMLEAAARKGGATLVSAGDNPGFACEQLAVVATGLCSRLDYLEVIETADSRPIRSPDYAFGLIGFGADPATFDPNAPGWPPGASLNGMFGETMAAMASHLGMKLQRVETAHEVFPATEDLQVAAGLIRRGTVSHVRLRWRGIVAGTARLGLSINWYMETAHLGSDEPPLWQIRIEGEPCVRLTVDVSKHASDRTRTGAEQIALAGSIVNTIPVVCAAEPGLLVRPIATPYWQPGAG